MEFVPDLEKNKEKGEAYVENPRMFETYSRAYVVTNENLRQLPQLMPKKHENILTVVGSGDHPMWFSLYGAKHIDTFDISYNAKILMDIKIAALSCLSWRNYKNLLNDLYLLNWYPFRCMSEIKNMCKILPKLPETESEYIKALGYSKIIRAKLEPKKSKSLPTFLEYVKLRIKVRGLYNFYMTDIRTLEKYLTKSYDVIHLSNILDYVPKSEHKNVILPLLNHVNPGGRIIAHNMCIDSSNMYCNYFDAAKDVISSFGNWRYMQKHGFYPDDNIILPNGTHIFERVR